MRAASSRAPARNRRRNESRDLAVVGGLLGWLTCVELDPRNRHGSGRERRRGGLRSARCRLAADDIVRAWTSSLQRLQPRRPRRSRVRRHRAARARQPHSSGSHPLKRAAIESGAAAPMRNGSSEQSTLSHLPRRRRSSHAGRRVGDPYARERKGCARSASRRSQNQSTRSFRTRKSRYAGDALSMRAARKRRGTDRQAFRTRGAARPRLRARSRAAAADEGGPESARVRRSRSERSRTNSGATRSTSSLSSDARRTRRYALSSTRATCASRRSPARSRKPASTRCRSSA